MENKLIRKLVNVSFCVLLCLYFVFLIFAYQAKKRGRRIKGIPKGSVAFESKRATEEYDAVGAYIRREATKDNKYVVILRYDGYVAWFRKFKNDYMRGRGKEACTKCEFSFHITC